MQDGGTGCSMFSGKVDYLGGKTAIDNHEDACVVNSFFF